MVEIKNSVGKVLSKSKNLRGITREIGKQPLKCVKVWQSDGNRNLIQFCFESGDICTTNFASMSVLIDWVRKRRNLRGVDIRSDVYTTAFAKRWKIKDVLSVLEFWQSDCNKVANEMEKIAKA